MLTWLLVAIRIVANPISNLFQKDLVHRSADPLFIIGVTHAILAAGCVPVLVTLSPSGLGNSFWMNILVAGAFAVSGNVLLVHALKSSDLSVLGPINAYKPLISLVLAVFMIHEIPTLGGILGVGLIVGGSYFVVDRDTSAPRRMAFIEFLKARGIQLRFAALVLSATEAIFLKKALLLSSPLTTFILWSILGLPIAGIALSLTKRRVLHQGMETFARHRSKYLWLAITTGLMQLTTLFTFGKLQVSYSLALFQMSAILSVFLGHRYFNERDFGKRLSGSMIMVAGAVLVVVSGLSKQ